MQEVHITKANIKSFWQYSHFGIMVLKYLKISTAIVVLFSKVSSQGHLLKSTSWNPTPLNKYTSRNPAPKSISCNLSLEVSPPPPNSREVHHVKPTPLNTLPEIDPQKTHPWNLPLVVHPLKSTLWNPPHEIYPLKSTPWSPPLNSTS